MNFKKHLLILFVALPFVAAAQPIQKPHLYEVSKGPNVSWVFGAMHVYVSLNDLKFSLAKPIYESDTIYFEVLSDPALLRNARARYLLWQKDPALALRISERKDFGKGSPLSLEAQNILIQELKIPSILASRLRNDSCEAFDGFLNDSAIHFDWELQGVAEVMNKQVFALDSEELRARADEVEPTENSASECNLESLIKAQIKVEQLYRSGDTINVDSRSHPGLTLRNNAWIATLAPELAKGKKLVAVGARHLYGTKGLLAQLKRLGFHIRRKEPTKG